MMHWRVVKLILLVFLLHGDRAHAVVEDQAWLAIVLSTGAAGKHGKLQLNLSITATQWRSKTWLL